MSLLHDLYASRARRLQPERKKAPPKSKGER